MQITAATRMHDAELDEATTMSKTGHRSVDGVRAYKLTTNRLQEISSAVLKLMILNWKPLILRKKFLLKVFQS